MNGTFGSWGTSSTGTWAAPSTSSNVHVSWRAASSGPEEPPAGRPAVPSSPAPSSPSSAAAHPEYELDEVW